MTADPAPIDVPTSARPRASIVVVAGAASVRVERCLARLAEVAPAVPFEVIVVLTGGGEARAAELRARLAGVRVEAGEVNVGFSAALNRGRALARGELLVSLHDDAEAQPGWLEALVAAATQDPGAGAVGSLTLNLDGTFRAAGWELLPDGFTQPLDEPRGAAMHMPYPVDYCGSNSLLIRAATWDAIGGADERLFPLYYVDVDLCLAIRAHGERVLCAPSSAVKHRGGASARPEFARVVGARNRALMLEKWGERITGHVPGSGATGDGGDVPRPVRELDHDRQERVQLERAGAVAAIYAQHLEARLETVTTYAEDLRPRLDAATAYAEDLRARLDDAETEMLWLRPREVTLRRIEAGGWWRLRGRLLPLLRLAARLRR